MLYQIENVFKGTTKFNMASGIVGIVYICSIDFSKIMAISISIYLPQSIN